MATNIDKSLYAAPAGLEELAAQEPEIEIEIVDPEEVTVGIDGLEISLTPDETDQEDTFDSNLAKTLPEGTLSQLATDLAPLS